MAKARHPMPPEIAALPLGEIAERHIAVPPGQGNPLHAHKEEVFFGLQSCLTVFLEDEKGRRVSRALAPLWAADGGWRC
jgi:hypothetical protein